MEPKLNQCHPLATLAQLRIDLLIEVAGGRSNKVDEGRRRVPARSHPRPHPQCHPHLGANKHMSMRSDIGQTNSGAYGGECLAVGSLSMALDLVNPSWSLGDSAYAYA